MFEKPDCANFAKAFLEIIEAHPKDTVISRLACKFSDPAILPLDLFDLLDKFVSEVFPIVV